MKTTPRRGLAQEARAPVAVRRRVKLPLVECAHEARPGEEMTPERVVDVLLEERAGARRDADRGELARRLLGSGRRSSPERDAVSELLAERESED